MEKQTSLSSIIYVNNKNFGSPLTVPQSLLFDAETCLFLLLLSIYILETSLIPSLFSNHALRQSFSYLYLCGYSELLSKLYYEHWKVTEWSSFSQLFFFLLTLYQISIKQPLVQSAVLTVVTEVNWVQRQTNEAVEEELSLEGRLWVMGQGLGGGGGSSSSEGHLRQQKQ